MAKDQQPSIMDLFARASADDLQTVNARVEELTKELDALRCLQRMLDIKINGKPARAAPGTRKKAPASTGNGFAAGGRGAITDKYRRDAARLLLAGPKRVAEIAEDCGIPTGSITGVLDHPWFGRNGGGEVHVTTEGRRSVPA